MDSTSHLRLPLPLTVAPETLQDARCRLASTDGRYLAVYCRRHRVGAVCDSAVPLWSIVGPIEFFEFQATLAASGFALPGELELQAWIDACRAVDAAPASH